MLSSKSSGERIVEFNRWLRSTKAELFTRRGQNGRILGRKLEAVGEAIDLRDVAIISGRLSTLFSSLSESNVSWLKPMRKQLARWVRESKDLKHLPASVLTDHVLLGEDVGVLLSSVAG